MRVGLIFGTRPEAIKIAVLYHELKKENIEVLTINTGQHKEMIENVLNIFNINCDYNLNIMKIGQSLSELTSRLIRKIDEIMKIEKLDYVLVQGDTTTVFAAALVSFYHKIPVGHIETGLRTGDIYSPFPEEANRKLVGVVTDLHFAPTDINVYNLIKEGYSKDKIIKTGNTVIDALKWIKKYKAEDLVEIRKKYHLEGKKYILLTMHRRENWGSPMLETLKAVKDYLSENRSIYLVFPMHLNPLIREMAKEVLKDVENAYLIEPLEYMEFISLMDGAFYIMTDSGGIQEEAPTLGKPTLVLRDTTERPEAIEAGTAKLVGTKYKNVLKYMKLLEGKLYKEMSMQSNPYGDGNACKYIVQALKERNKL